MTYGCYRCGIVDGEIRFNDTFDEYVCENCGTMGSVVTFLQSLDMINDAYLSGYAPHPIDMDELEEALYPEDFEDGV